MEHETRIRSRTQLISFLETKHISISQHNVREILEHMHHGTPTYVTHDGRLIRKAYEQEQQPVVEA